MKGYEGLVKLLEEGTAPFTGPASTSPRTQVVTKQPLLALFDKSRFPARRA
jgi:hypothetical protein